MYKRGSLNSDGTITWGTTYDTGVDANNTRPVIKVDSQGYPYILWQTNTTWMLLKSSTNNGVWTTDYNKTVLYMGPYFTAWYYRGDIVFDANDSPIVMIWPGQGSGPDNYIRAVYLSSGSFIEVRGPSSNWYDTFGGKDGVARLVGDKIVLYVAGGTPGASSNEMLMTIYDLTNHTFDAGLTYPDIRAFAAVQYASDKFYLVLHGRSGEELTRRHRELEDRRVHREVRTHFHAQGLHATEDRRYYRLLVVRNECHSWQLAIWARQESKLDRSNCGIENVICYEKWPTLNVRYRPKVDVRPWLSHLVKSGIVGPGHNLQGASNGTFRPIQHRRRDQRTGNAGIGDLSGLAKSPNCQTQGTFFRSADLADRSPRPAHRLPPNETGSTM